MLIHELVSKTNLEIIKGKNFTTQEKDKIITQLLQFVSSKDEVKRFQKGVRAPEDGRIMYPLFYILPYNNGKKLRTINGVLPATYILSANHFELEILRLLALWTKNDISVDIMLIETKKRLLTTCFGKFCSTGECFETSIVVLRFLVIAFPDELTWIQSLFEKISKKIDRTPSGQKRRKGILIYYWLTLIELDLAMIESEIMRYEDMLLRYITKNRNHLESDNIYDAMDFYIARNLLSRLPKYQHLNEIEYEDKEKNLCLKL